MPKVKCSLDIIRRVLFIMLNVKNKNNNLTPSILVALFGTTHSLVLISIFFLMYKHSQARYYIICLLHILLVYIFYNFFLYTFKY